MGEALRVLLVLATSDGGTGRHVADVARGLTAPLGGDRASRADPSTDPEIRVAVAGPRPTLAALDLPMSVRRVEVAVRTRPHPPGDLAAVLTLRRLARDADVVHAHGVRAGALAVAAARTLRRRPAVVVTAHNAAGGGGALRAVHALLTTVVARGADAVLGVSGDLVEELRARGAGDAARALVPAPASPPPARTPEEVRAALGVPAGAALLVTAARLAPQKGLDVLAAAVRALGPGVVAVVAGDGPLEPQLRGGPLRLLGRRDDVPDLFAAADVVVVPSRWEGQPLNVQEALRAGAAIVATDAGGTRDVTADAAVLVPPGDARALAAAVRGVLDDPGQRDRLRAAARRRAAELPTAADAERQLRALYGRLAGARRSH